MNEIIKYFFCVGVCLLWLFNILSLKEASFVTFMVYLINGGHYTMYLIWHTLPRDIRGGYRYGKTTLLIYYYWFRDLTLPKVFTKVAKKYSSKPCLIFEDVVWNFQELEEYSNKVGHYFLCLGYKPGDVVALFMHSCPEYVGLWLGCAKIGIVPALINSHLQGHPLKCSIDAAAPIALIYGWEHDQAVRDVAGDIPNVKLFVSGQHETPLSTTMQHQSDLQVIQLDPEIANSNPQEIPESIQKQLHFKDKLLLIFTSGTTGLPKAAVIKHARFYFYCVGMYYLTDIGSLSNPVLYDPLPLYHTIGGVVGVGMALVFGCTVVIKKKFSVRNFWKDCVKHKCNAAQYIGETCRYLLSAPVTPEERTHCVEVMFGNGLKPQIWSQFAQRFGIKRIIELYGATEGNSSLVNIDSKPGAVGFTTVLFPFVYPARLLRVDESGEVLRDSKSGLCILCKPWQTGEFVGKIVRNNPSREFDGYLDETANERKIVRNVMKHGDMWFRTGDLLTMDEFGWMYFVDRMGENYRWRGENVSSSEVEAVLSKILEQQDAIVYGVEVPGVEGRAGMAAIVEPIGGIDLKMFLSAIKNQLPSYAMPIFLRMVEKLDVTGTFKLKKIAFQREGFNPNVILDRMFFYDNATCAYRELDPTLYNDIIEKRARL